MEKYNVVKAREGEYQKYLDDGYEPFGAIAEDSSYYFTNTTNNRREMHPQTTVYLFLRKIRDKK